MAAAAFISAQALGACNSCPGKAPFTHLEPVAAQEADQADINLITEKVSDYAPQMHKSCSGCLCCLICTQPPTAVPRCESAAAPRVLCATQVCFDSVTRFEDSERLPLGITVNSVAYSADMLCQAAFEPQVGCLPAAACQRP